MPPGCDLCGRPECDTAVVGLLIPRPELAADERIIWTKVANRVAGKRVLGGRLFVTSSRLIFVPHRLDAAFPGSPWSIERGDVEAFRAEYQPPIGAFNWGLRKRLIVELRAGDDEAFVVWRTENCARELSQLLGLDAR